MIAGYTLLDEYRPPSRLRRERSVARAYRGLGADVDADVDSALDPRLLGYGDPGDFGEFGDDEGLSTDTIAPPKKAAKKPPALGRVVLDADPAVLQRLDRIADIAEEAQKKATLVVGALTILGVVWIVSKALTARRVRVSA